MGDWKALHRLLPTLKEQKAISSSAINEIEEDIALIEITKAAHQPTTMGLESLWKTFSKNIQTSPRVLEQYVKALIQLHDYDHAQKRIEKTLAAVWVPTLVPLYTLIKSHNTAKLIVTEEKWLKRHPKDKTLVCLAKMSFSSSFYPKASQYIQQLISNEPSAAAWSLLGEIHVAQQQLSEAIVCYKKAIHAR